MKYMFRVTGLSHDFKCDGHKHFCIIEDTAEQAAKTATELRFLKEITSIHKWEDVHAINGERV